MVAYMSYWLGGDKLGCYANPIVIKKKIDPSGRFNNYI